MTILCCTVLVPTVLAGGAVLVAVDAVLPWAAGRVAICAVPAAFAVALARLDVARGVVFAVAATTAALAVVATRAPGLARYAWKGKHKALVISSTHFKLNWLSF